MESSHRIISILTIRSAIRLANDGPFCRVTSGRSPGFHAFDHFTSPVANSTHFNGALPYCACPKMP